MDTNGPILWRIVCRVVGGLFSDFYAHSCTFHSRIQFGQWYLAPLRKGALKI